MIAGRSWGTAVYFGAVRDGQRVVGVALPAGLYLIVTAGTSDDALAILIDDAASATADAPGIVGPTDVARKEVDLWTARTGQRDLDVVATWFVAFVKEWQPYLDASEEAARENAQRWIDGGQLRLWDDDGVASMAGATGPTAHGIRVAAVYTPPTMRGRGYASNLVAALSQEQLDAGRCFCFLFTDLANPTSNKIYTGTGYEPVIDVDQYAFVS